jgi:hypothetical protein
LGVLRSGEASLVHAIVDGVVDLRVDGIDLGAQFNWVIVPPWPRAKPVEALFIMRMISDDSLLTMVAYCLSGWAACHTKHVALWRNLPRNVVECRPARPFGRP